MEGKMKLKETGKHTFMFDEVKMERNDTMCVGGRTVYYGHTVEDFDLKYVENIFRDLPGTKKKCEELLLKAKKKQEEYEKMKTKVMAALKETFRPEFLNRIDETVVFHSLSKENIMSIVDLMLKELAGQLR